MIEIMYCKPGCNKLGKVNKKKKIRQKEKEECNRRERKKICPKSNKTLNLNLISTTRKFNLTEIQYFSLWYIKVFFTVH